MTVSARDADERTIARVRVNYDLEVRSDVVNFEIESLGKSRK